mgnify:CR=1 FL=1
MKLQVRDAVLDYMKEELSEEPEEKQCLSRLCSGRVHIQMRSVQLEKDSCGGRRRSECECGCNNLLLS